MANSELATIAKRAALTRLPGARPRVVRTLAELDECLEDLERAAAVSDDELRKGFSTFRMELDTEMPRDPYSEEYRRAVFDMYEWLHGKPYAPSNEHTLFELERYVDVPFPYATQSGPTVGNYLMATGHVLRTLNLPPKSRVLELGPGWGETTLALAQMGHDVTAIDIGQNFVDLINARAARLNAQVEAIVGDFSMIRELDGGYDAVLFFECFHHCADHLQLLADLAPVVAPGGQVMFAGEPIAKVRKDPWGLRMDGESLWAIRKNGWLELGFRRSYFLQTLERYGWKAERVNCAATPSGEIFVTAPRPRFLTSTPLARVRAKLVPMRPFPEVEAYESGRLDVGDGHDLSWETSGNRDGKPVVVLHGGPGSGSSPAFRRMFDPSVYRIVQFDQRNCGHSTPHASDAAVDLATNTTQHLVDDCERLREHLGIDRWMVWGGSWGSTLGLAYAQAHPERVTKMILVSVCTTTHAEVEWVTRSMGRIFPEEWARFRDALPEADRDGDLSAAYARLLRDPDPSVRDAAAHTWCEWEDTHIATYAGYRHDPRYDDPRFRMCFARLVTHYWSNAAFLDDGQLLRDAHRLAGIPGALITGRLDISGPPDIAWQLAREWPGAELVLVDDAGHGAGHPSTLEAILTATTRFGRR